MLSLLNPQIEQLHHIEATLIIDLLWLTETLGLLYNTVFSNGLALLTSLQSVVLFLFCRSTPIPLSIL